MRGFSVTSELAAPPDVLWAHATSPAGIDRELRPLLRMTFPGGTEDITAAWRPGARLLRHWNLRRAFGSLPA